MSAIPVNWGDGGNNLNPKEHTAAKPSMAQAMRDVADDLAALKPGAPAVTVGADIGVFTDPPSAAEMALLRTFVNALKADAAAVVAEMPSGITLLTTKV